MASAVTTPLERQFGKIAGVTEMTSTSSLGSDNITCSSILDRSIDAQRVLKSKPPSTRRRGSYLPACPPNPIGGKPIRQKRLFRFCT